VAKLLMNGSEQTLFENTELGEFAGYVFLTPLQTGDSVTLKFYVKDVEANEYVLNDGKTYTGAQSYPAIEVRHVIGKVGVKVTIRQTAGTYRTIHHMWFGRVR